MTVSQQEPHIIRVSLWNEASVLVEFSDGVSRLISAERLRQWILESPDSIVQMDEGK